MDGVLNITLVEITARPLKRIHRPDILAAVKRYETGDWGDVSDKLAERNNVAVRSGGGLIVSAYHDSKGKRFMLVTGKNRSRVHAMLFSEFVWLVIRILWTNSWPI